MPELRLYGASDDLIEIEGDFAEEIPYYSSSDERLYLAVSDGILATVEYSGFWRIHVEVLGHGTTVEKHEGTDEDTIPRCPQHGTASGQFCQESKNKYSQVGRA